MSNHKDNNTNKRLKDFLDSSGNSSEESMDDFEREAMEGFATIASEEEILDLKTKLDKRAYSEVFTKEKKSSQVFWYAAAGLFLVIGFSVYLIKNDPSTKRNDLAIHQKNEVLSPVETEPKKEIAEESLMENTSSDSVTALEKDPPKAETLKKIQSKSNLKAKADPEEKEVNDGLTKDMDENSVATASMKASKALSVPNQVESAQIMESELKMNNYASGALNTPVPSQNEIAISSVKVKKEKNASKKKRMAVPKAEKNRDDAALQEDRFVSSCYYTGGEDALFKDLRLLLKEKELLLKFNATLYINENKKVEKAVITNDFGMNDSEKEKVIEILKQLSKFNLNNPGSSRYLAEYQLFFKP